MPDFHSEVELKFDATGVDTHSFVTWCLNRGPFKYEHIQGPDIYYRRGANVIRHRWSGGAGELTVKLRRKRSSIVNRTEIDLRFDNKMGVNDVTAFLEASGWKKAFTIMKEAHIFWFDDRGKQVTVVIYDSGVIGCNGNLTQKKRFLEIEMEKGNQDLSCKDAERELKNWKREISRWFKLGIPMNESLYEIYSGKKYIIRKAS